MALFRRKSQAGQDEVCLKLSTQARAILASVEAPSPNGGGLRIEQMQIHDAVRVAGATAEALKTGVAVLDMRRLDGPRQDSINPPLP